MNLDTYIISIYSSKKNYPFNKKNHACPNFSNLQFAISYLPFSASSFVFRGRTAHHTTSLRSALCDRQITDSKNFQIPF